MGTRTQDILDNFNCEGDFYRLAEALSREMRQGTATLTDCKEVISLQMILFFHGDMDAIWKMACNLDNNAKYKFARHYDFEMEEYMFT